MLVVCFHLGGNLVKDKYFGNEADLLEKLCGFGGAAGVGFFFVLSGFIITFIHRRDFGQPRRLWPYLRKRIVRIYPAYFIVFAGVFALAMAIPSLRDTVPSDLWVLIKALLLLPQDGEVIGGTGAPVVVVAWSLQFEVVFYAVMALAIVNRYVFALAVAAYAVNFVWQAVSPAPTFPGTFFGRHLTLLFVIGVGAAYVVQSEWRLRRPLMTAALAILLFFGVGAAAIVLGLGSYPVAFDLGYGLAGALAIVALTQAERQRPHLFQSRLAMWLGDSSYALYLIHFPLISVLCKAAVAIGLEGAFGVALSFVGIILICVVVSLLFHWWIEKPILRVLTAQPPAPVPAPADAKTTAPSLLADR